MGWEVGGRLKREETYVYLWQIHVDVWQRPTQYCKAIILQLKANKLKIDHDSDVRQPERSLSLADRVQAFWGLGVRIP